MTSSIESSDSGSARAIGVRRDRSMVAMSSRGTLRDAAVLVAAMFNTPCCFQVQSAQRPILTSMERRSYMIWPSTALRVSPGLLVALLLLPSPVAASGGSDAAELHVISSHSHDDEAFTQGFEMHGGSLYESTGLYGHSSLREVDPSSGEVLRQTQLDQSLFGEGITILGDTIVMLTWKEGIALVFDIETFEVVGNHTYSGEGWGLCYNGEFLVMSNGTSELALRDPSDFTVQSTLLVTLDGQEASLLNELECVGGMIYANVLGSDSILAINSTSGAVEFTVDASQLAESESGGSNEVLNGIAYVSEQDAFLVTGKNWSSMHLVSFESGQELVEDDITDSDVSRILTSIWPVLLIAALVVILSSMRALGAIIHFLMLLLLRRQTEQPPAPSEGEQEAGEAR
ncbi:MAG TPA: glutaminyl-peptide cyclotransferase [Candidatus Poseidoniales archaeon]|nr:glutaminyl-peptide cyclotransferase [Candidatus Poseidoniales archaeon]